MYARFAVPTLDEHPYEAIAVLLEDAVRVMQHRAQDLADGKIRTHTPTVEEPLILVVVDEIANLTAYLTDRKLRDRIANALGLLLTQGRAVGVCVVAALQDPRKEVLAFRNLFPAKVALRLDEPVQIDMVLGQGAREQGARCDRIGDALHGVGYVRIDGVREPTRVRAAYVTNEDIAAMIFDYAAPRPPWTVSSCFGPASATSTTRSSSCPAPVTPISPKTRTNGRRRERRGRSRGADGRRHGAVR
ncbi:MAG: segregation ATPase FtsK/SpoIIIE, family [Solirubrobacteraceae bacterium]|nr:segregation ATPase FtsK/SpoIIIE, family [Solirubrobacteraceae bacterium]